MQLSKQAYYNYAYQKAAIMTNRVGFLGWIYIISIALGACNAIQTLEYRDEIYFHPDEIELPDLLESYSVSKGVAENWQKGAYLTSVLINVDPLPNHLRYVFTIPGTSQWLSVYPVKYQNEYQFETMKGDYPEEKKLEPIDLENIPTTLNQIYRTAFLAAETDIKHTGLSIDSILIQLDQTYGLRWWVSFTLGDRSKVIHVALDPMNGEITEIRKTSGFDE